MNNFKLRIACLFFTIIYFFAGIITPVFADVSYSYDANGNLTSDGQNCYTYNDANQLSQVKNCATNQIIAQYVYDYQGNRIEKKIYSSGSLQNTVYSPDKTYETVKQASNGATTNTSYYYVNDQLAAKKNPDSTKNYYLSDNLGSVNVLTNQAGTVIENSTYYPFGQIRSGGTQSKYLYTGQQNDQETNLDYYNARYYDPSNMHFTQPDSELPNVYDPQQLKRYSYVRNNPMTINDPTGHDISTFLGGSLSLFALQVVGAIHGAMTATNTSFMGRLQGAIVGAQDASQSPFGQIAMGVATIGLTTPLESEMIANNAGDGETSVIRQNYIKGQVGEQNANIVKNTSRIDSLTGTANYRIPDELGLNAAKDPNYLNDIKNVNVLRQTNQLNDFAAYGNKYNFTPNLTIDMRTQIAPTQQDWFNTNFNIIRTNLNGD